MASGHVKRREFITLVGGAAGLPLTAFGKLKAMCEAAAIVRKELACA